MECWGWMDGWMDFCMCLYKLYHFVCRRDQLHEGLSSLQRVKSDFWRTLCSTFMMKKLSVANSAYSQSHTHMTVRKDEAQGKGFSGSLKHIALSVLSHLAANDPKKSRDMHIRLGKPQSRAHVGSSHQGNPHIYRYKPGVISIII